MRRSPRPAPRLGLALAAAALAGLAGAGAAQAAVVQMGGSPLAVYADGLGGIQARFAGQDAGEFYPPSSNPGHAGLELAVVRPGDTSETTFGLNETGMTAVNGPTPGSPHSGVSTLTSEYMAPDANGNPILDVVESLSYTSGTEELNATYAIRNATSAPLSFRVGELSDLYAGGDDTGTGFLDAGPPREVGGRQTQGFGTGALVEQTPWSHYQEGAYGDVFTNFGNGALNDQIDPTSVDNGVGTEWDVANLGPGATDTISVRWTFSPAQTTLPPAVFGQSFDVTVVKGVVRVQLPGGSFTPLIAGQQLPLGSTVDTTHGTVALTAARDRSGRQQSIDLFDGIFKTTQTGAGRARGARTAARRPPLTVFTLKGALPTCGKARGATAARRKVHQRHLWGDGHGNFQTRGHYSAATVRGTRWLTEDTCAGTLTRVTRGVVTVRDFVRRRTVKVRAGHSYLARAPRRRHG